MQGSFRSRDEIKRFPPISLSSVLVRLEFPPDSSNNPALINVFLFFSLSLFHDGWAGLGSFLALYIIVYVAILQLGCYVFERIRKNLFTLCDE